MALAMIDYLVKSLAASDGLISHLSPDQLNNGDIMLKKLKKFISKQGFLSAESINCNFFYQL
jgi:hypothetical protein